MSLRLRPTTQLEARLFIAKHHRHSKAPMRVVACVGVEADGQLVGVGTLERPKAAMLCDGATIEASRVCTLGQRNACSMLYGALARAAAALGYQRIVTYTLESETGASLRAAGWTPEATVKPETWDRRRVQAAGHQPGLWERKYGAAVPRVRWERRVA
jgi:hypothetical protein